MNPKERALHFASLHVKGNPLVLYNAWDAGSAKTIAKSGAPAIATSSWAVAAAQGYADGESIPFALVEQIVGRIAGSVELPVTVDVEGAYSDDPQTAAQNVARLLDLGIVGINFEDRVVGGTGLHAIEAQSARIAAIRAVAQARDIPLFINLRSDVFFGTKVEPGDGLAQLRARAAAYARAGASGLFVPGLTDLRVITDLCATCPLPVNVLELPGLPDTAALAGAGVARISYGTMPYEVAMSAAGSAAAAIYARS